MSSGMLQSENHPDLRLTTLSVTIDQSCNQFPFPRSPTSGEKAASTYCTEYKIEDEEQANTATKCEPVADVSTNNRVNRVAHQSQ